jgi:hypothetical protein
MPHDDEIFADINRMAGEPQPKPAAVEPPGPKPLDTEIKIDWDPKPEPEPYSALPPSESGVRVEPEVIPPAPQRSPGGRWVPGQSGNPSGRPKSRKFKETLKRILEKANGYEAVAAALLARAENGDVAAIKEVFDRVDGKVPAVVGGAEELGPVLVRWLHPNEEPGVLFPDEETTEE